MPTGPLGGPRPLADTQMIIAVEVKDEFASLSELLIEQEAMDAIPQIDFVSVSESFEHEGVTVTFVTRKERIDLADVKAAESIVDDVVDVDITDRDVLIKSK